MIAEVHGTVSSLTTVPHPTEKAAGAVVIGTSGRNNLYAFAADASDPPRMLRQFRGHGGDVASMSVSPDGRYLVSGSTDATMMIWNLQDMFAASENVNRWGVDFLIEKDALLVQSAREDGPLYFRGVRGGDRLIGIRWADSQGKAFAESEPKAMLEKLSSLPFDTLVVFEFTRLSRPREAFQSFAAWQPLATVMVDRAREWAMWTPAGFYDASFDGHRRFGWQINRGVNALPDFYQAAQFRRTLERSAIMRRLLRAGSLPAAMRDSISGIGPPPGDNAIVNQIQNQPVIRILEPAIGAIVKGDRVQVRAEIDTQRWR